ncbi:CoA transferase, partial [Craterilacuibacter sp.]|uniref:CoA transferase n=1 Tax=Craterilacuibacter sp. TaxID=2870909 RepID=UPI003F3D126B
PCGPINTVDEAFADPQIRHRQMALQLQDSAGQQVPQVACPIRLSGTPLEYTLAPPKLGEHSATILGELGYTPQQIAALREQSVV